MSLKQQSGFTVLELIVVFAIAGILFSTAFPSLGQVFGQMQAASDARALAQNIAQLRAEAIRQRINISITFSSTGYSWDFDADGSIEGTRALGSQSTWASATPSQIIINGLGLTRSSSTQQVITINNRGYSTRVTLNKNGHVKL